ncbi:hypothetical protein Pla22_31240 [Rubripirellula amarantea]|uniref:DinB superfamily protein n=1 Tax=Rubripirellula amarantea TaxID=2527999 RepID=A0A5C5WKI7_9BACT|nr:DinB family protein [Rubripirellula amarantea]TWT50382.1 hypothetical protein Pla22_31240 [Rubripirellula amarantea]
MQRTTFLLIALLSLALVRPAVADEGQPMVLRKIDDQTFQIELHTGEALSIDSKTKADSPTPPGFAINAHQLSDKASSAIEVIADGVSVLYVTKQSLGESIAADLQPSVHPDVIIAASMPLVSGDESSLGDLVAKLMPSKVVVASSSGNLAETREHQAIGHNAMALCATDNKATAPTKIVTLADADGFDQLDEELKDLFQAMTKSCEASQAVFAKLSVEQMNFRPSNGTHTPRWNSEHMRGRQLQFFSQIYYAIDPTIPVMDRNPKQMPDDYTPHQPDWDGARESLETKRVNDFCRRFAYLLDGIPLDQKAPGSSWTLDRLLKQMDRHYGEHTANVVKKFELADWPEAH